VSVLPASLRFKSRPRDTWMVTSTAHSTANRSTFVSGALLERHLREPFEKFVDWWQCAAVMQREAVTVMPSCDGGGNVVVA
jgi:hypothetical protein